jgi:hypothetical protein
MSRRWIQRALLGVLANAAIAASLLTAAPVSADVDGNMQVRLPHNLYFADVNGDGRADLLQVANDKLFAFNADYNGTPILHKYFDQNVSRLVIGDFTSSGREHGKDQVCAIFADNSWTWRNMPAVDSPTSPA